VNPRVAKQTGGWTGWTLEVPLPLALAFPVKVALPLSLPAALDHGWPHGSTENLM